MDETSPGEPPAGQLVKVLFDLPQDEDGWPGVGSEGLWAVTVAPGVVRLANTPFFVRGVANGDLMRVRRGEDGQLLADGQLEWSGYCTIRIIVFRDGLLGGSLQRVFDVFAPLGVTGEGFEQYSLVALEVPPEADLAAVQRLLRDGTRDGWWEYEEGCISDAWSAAGPSEDRSDADP